MNKFNESLSKRNADVIEKGDITVYEIDCTPNFPTPVVQDIPATGLIKPTPTSALLATTQPNLISSNGVLLPSGSVASSVSPVFSGQPTTYQLVVGPRMGLIVTPSSPAPTNVIPASPSLNSSPSQTATLSTVATRVQVRPQLGNVNQPSPKRFVSPTVTTASTPSPKITVNPSVQKIPPPPAKTSVPTVTSTVNTRSKGKLNSRTPETNNSEIVPPKAPSSKATSGGSVTSSAVVDLTDDEGNKPAADSKEVSFNRFPGRIYPSLVVVARPNLKVKEMTSSVITAERTQLDTKVKGILTNSPTKFTEWLIQQGLVRSEQVCNNHTGSEFESGKKLKLGMYSDASKFPYSGGYVWISDCCPQKFVSVFCNSIFEGAPHAPTVLLKLIYHWACQTNVHNIISWVKVDNLYIKNFFTNLRAVCTAAICEKFGKMGGPGKKIEVGVISLGTTSQNGSVRQVKVEVLGIMDPISKYIRLRAVDPVQNAEKNHKLRFSRILESLEQWVHKSTTIVTDYTVDRATLNELGFHSVIQSQLNSQSRENNQAIMDYLKRVVPRMFQNTLSLLSRSIIQQFLDELVWRERWGPIASRAFDNLVLHLSEMTRLDTGDTLINRLKSITANPFRDWSYKNWKLSISSNITKKVAQVENDLSLPKQTTVRLKVNVAHKTYSPNTNKSNSKSMVNLTVDDSLDDVASGVTVADVPQGVIELEDDNMSVSSNNSRRSRARSSINDDKSNSSSSSKQWGESQSILKSLETYYYGDLPPDGIVLNKLKKVDLNMKCFVCGLTYNNNILFMKHLAGHAQDEGAFTTEHQCRYCLKNFTSAFDLEDHKGSVHFSNKYNAMCLICNERFKHRGALINHMQTTHCELELPYQCNICKFRTSQHTKVVDHFYDVHDGGEKVQCPFCLKIVAFESTNGTKITQNVNFFFNHLQRHQKKPIRKCNKCTLTFVNKTLLKEHQTKDHTSCVNMTGITRHPFLDMSTILMPVPSSTPSSSSLVRKGKQMSVSIPSYSMYKLDNTIFYPEMAVARCLECKMDILGNQHFTSYMTCMKCMFGTCCKVTMNRHVEKCHEIKGKRKNAQRKIIPLKNPLYCVCGFSSSCGNEMASHLVHCKRRIAYPNPERAAQYAVQMQSASFPPLVNLDDMEQGSDDASNKWLRAFVKTSASADDEQKCKRMAISEKSPPRMLKELGLVRKESPPAESDSTKTPELDDSDSNSETLIKEKPQVNKSKKDVQNTEVSSSEAEDEVEQSKAEDICTPVKINETNNYTTITMLKNVVSELNNKFSGETEGTTETADESISVTVSEDKLPETTKPAVTIADESKSATVSVDESNDEIRSISSVSLSAQKENMDTKSAILEHNDTDAEIAPILAAVDENGQPLESVSSILTNTDKTSDSSVTDNNKIDFNENTDEIGGNVIDSIDQSSIEQTKETANLFSESVEKAIPMETDELNTVDGKVSDLEENPVAMECDKTPEEGSKTVDLESPDVMMVD